MTRVTLLPLLYVLSYSKAAETMVLLRSTSLLPLNASVRTLKRAENTNLQRSYVHAGYIYALVGSRELMSEVRAQFKPYHSVSGECHDLYPLILTNSCLVLEKKRFSTIYSHTCIAKDRSWRRARTGGLARTLLQWSSYALLLNIFSISSTWLLILLNCQGQSMTYRNGRKLYNVSDQW
jgi:hypothetical protein